MPIPVPDPDETSTLRRRGPAARWLEALPLGNGRIGAMAWGDPRRARFSLNESTLWSGGPDVDRARRASAGEATAARARAGELAEVDRWREAEEVLSALGASWSQAFQPVGELVVEIADVDEAEDAGERTADAGEPNIRSLDLRTGVHTVAAPPAPQTAQSMQTTFTSLADEVLVHIIDRPVDLHASFSSPLVEELRETAGPSARDVDGGRTTGEGGALDVVVRAPSDAPPSHAPDRSPVLWEETGASRAAVVVRWRREGARTLLVCAIETTWRDLGQAPDRPVDEVLASARGRAAEALARGADELLARHLAAPLPDVGAVDLSLHGDESSPLLAQVFAFGRHVIAASSREGLPPANLQGLWNTEVLAPWSSNYTANINLEMNHWAVGPAQMHEAERALAAFVAMLREQGRETARRLYGADGWALHHNSDPWGFSDPVDGDASWALWPMGGLWLEQLLDDAADFHGTDPSQTARERLPARRDVAAFALDLLYEQADGTLATFPSTSPENRWADGAGRPVALTRGSGMDRWLVRGALERFIEAAEAVEHEDGPHEGTLREDTLLERARAALPRIPGPRVGADGRILEWHDALPEVEPHHRHLSHLGFAHPGTAPLTPALEQAVTRSLEARGDEATGWSLVWKICQWARLRRADKVARLLGMFLRAAESEDHAEAGSGSVQEHAADGAESAPRERAGLYPNLFAAHPPFQIDGNMGFVAAVAECLLQSHRGEVELLPAAPGPLASGAVRGLRARPGLVVDMTWEDGRPRSARIAAVGPAAAGVHRVRWRDATCAVEVPADGWVEIDAEELAASAQR